MHTECVEPSFAGLILAESKGYEH